MEIYFFKPIFSKNVGSAILSSNYYVLFIVNYNYYVTFALFSVYIII